MTILPAHSYRIIWCDKQEGIRDLHAPFKLANSEQKLVLSAADGSWHDTFTYTAHGTTETIGRYPDASRNVYCLTRPTIDKTNELSTLSTPVRQPDAEAIQQILPDDFWADDYTIYDLSGRLVREGSGSLTESLPAGAYVVRTKGQAFKVMAP